MDKQTTDRSNSPPTLLRSKTSILFLCTGNSCRSQMAEGWARHLKSESLDPYSAGTERHGLNEMAVKVMAEADVDISEYRSKLLDELAVKEFDYVVTVCDNAQESCPVLPAVKKIIHMGFADPPRLAANAKTYEEALTHYREVRDKIRDFVKDMPENLQLLP